MKLLLGFAPALLCTHAVLAIVFSRGPINFEKAGIVPEILPKAPRDVLNVSFATSVVCFGNEIPHTHTTLRPRVEYNYKPGVNYTLLFVDPDLPVAAVPAFRFASHWIVVNIPGDNIAAGHSVASYLPLIFYPHSGYRRYLILLYAQNKYIDATRRDIRDYGIYRIRFPLADFIRNYDIGELVAGNYFISSLESAQRFCKA